MDEKYYLHFIVRGTERIQGPPIQGHKGILITKMIPALASILLTQVIRLCWVLFGLNLLTKRLDFSTNS